jgi:hypothetical protein
MNATAVSSDSLLTLGGQPVLLITVPSNPTKTQPHELSTLLDHSTGTNILVAEFVRVHCGHCLASGYGKCTVYKRIFLQRYGSSCSGRDRILRRLHVLH